MSFNPFGDYDDYDDDDMGKNFYKEEEEEEIEYKVEFKDIQRTAAYKPELDFNIRDKKVLKTISDETKFKIYVNIEFNNIKDTLKLSNEDLDLLLEKVDITKDVKFKSPIAFILGYYVVKDKKINKIRYDKVIRDILPQIKKESNIRAEDVIKYARYWILHLD